MAGLKANNETGRIELRGYVGYEDADSFTSEQVRDALDAMEPYGRDVSVVLQSDGGIVTDGLAIYNALAAYPGRVDLHVDSMAASIATVVMLGANRVTVSKTATVMIHRAWTVAMGNAIEFRSMSELLEQMDGQIADLYAEKSGRPTDEWLALMTEETWLKAGRALDLGLIDAVIDPKTGLEVSAAASRTTSTSNPGNVPARRPALLAKVQAFRQRARIIDTGNRPPQTN